MAKRTRSEFEIDSYGIESFFDSILHASSGLDYPKEYLNTVKERVLAELSSKEITKAATDFTLSEAIETFGLKYQLSPNEFTQNHHWDIEKDVGKEEFPTTPYIESLIQNYSMNFDRTSEATCRTAIDFILNECLTVMKGLNEIEDADGDARPKTPSPLNDIKIHGDVSFTHKVISRKTKRPSPNIVVDGHVDHAIGLILNTRFKDAVDQRRRCFYSLLLLVEAKFDSSVDHALDQLIVYLASLRQSRLQRGRPDASVYGLASDGYKFRFVKISHGGTVMCSKKFDILLGDMKKVLGCLKHILEVTASRSPQSMPERNDGDSDNDEEDESDPLLNLDDNKFMNLPPRWEDSEDDA